MWHALRKKCDIHRPTERDGRFKKGMFHDSPAQANAPNLTGLRQVLRRVRGAELTYPARTPRMLHTYTATAARGGGPGPHAVYVYVASYPAWCMYCCRCVRHEVTRPGTSQSAGISISIGVDDLIRRGRLSSKAFGSRSSSSICGAHMLLSLIHI